MDEDGILLICVICKLDRRQKQELEENKQEREEMSKEMEEMSKEREEKNKEMEAQAQMIADLKRQLEQKK